VIFKLRHIKIDKAVALVCLLFASCNYTKHLTDNQTLLDKNKIKLQTNTPIKNKAELESGILSLASPQPNSHLLDLGLLPKFKLWKYNNKFKLYSKDTLNPKIARRKVEKPALIDTLEIKNSEKSIRQYMFNQGYFYSKVNSAIIPDPKKAKTSSIEYSIEVGKSYTINEISYESESPVLLNVINETKSMSGQTKQALRTEVKNRVKTLSNSSQALLRGVVPLGDCYTKGREVRVTVGIKPETIASAGNLAGGISKSVSEQPTATSSKPAAGNKTKSNANAKTGTQKDLGELQPLQDMDSYSNSKRLDNF
jgi:hypothetical protein